MQNELSRSRTNGFIDTWEGVNVYKLIDLSKANKTEPDLDLDN